MNMFLANDAKREREDYLEISLMLPFQSDTSTGMGIVVKGYCDAVWHMSKQVPGGMTGPAGQQVKGAAVEMMEQPFGPSIKNVKAELERGFRFWDCVRFRARSPRGGLLTPCVCAGLPRGQHPQRGGRDGEGHVQAVSGRPHLAERLPALKSRDRSSTACAYRTELTCDDRSKIRSNDSRGIPRRVRVGAFHRSTTIAHHRLRPMSEL
jgi:hypothetical protein